MAGVAFEALRSLCQTCRRDMWNSLLILTLFLLTFAFILPQLCQHWVYSHYFQGDKNSRLYVKRALEVNDDRLVEAENYFEAQNKGDPQKLLRHHLMSVDGDVDVAIGIITISRHEAEEKHQSGKLGYLTQVAAKVHQLARDSPHMGKKRVFICNVDAFAHKHMEARYLSQFIPTVQRFDNKTVTWKDVKKHMDIFEKEKEDYAYCMVQALELDPRYVLLIEDDAIPYDSVFETAEFLLNMQVVYSGNRQDQLSAGRPWLFLKLYYPEKWQGYGNELSKYLELIAVGLLGGASFVFVFNVLMPRLQRRIRSSHSTLRTFIYFSLGATYWVLLVFLVGRPYIHSLRRLSPYFVQLVASPDCCTQAILYPAHIARKLARYLTTVHCTESFSVDLAIDKYAVEEGLIRYLTEPNLVKHIGLVSTVRGYAKGAAEFM